MRLLAFTLLTIAISVGIQLGFGQLAENAFNGMHGIDAILFFMSPAIVTAGLAYAMRVKNGYAVFLAIAAPVVSFALFAFIRVAFLHDHLV